MPELLLLLLPLAAFSGWLVGRRQWRSRSDQSGQARDLPPAYFQGLNYLLNEQPDKAIEAFTRLVEVDADTVETHLALGNLFRRRGEVDRAIRVHQNLLARPALDRGKRAYALLELGRDYMRGGLLDRAEALFREVVELDEHAETALRCLLDIYQQEKEWESAIDVAERLADRTGAPLHREIAQFCCEQGDQAWRQGAIDSAREGYKRAQRYDGRCVRASIALGDLALDGGQLQAAKRAYKRLARQDIEYLPEVLDRLERCYGAEARENAFRRYLEAVLDDYDGTAVAIKLSELIADHDGRRSAVDFLAAQLRRRPSVRGLNQLVELSLDEDDTDQRRQRDLRVLHELLMGLMENRGPYRCGDCGFEPQYLHWQCPSCRRWGTIKPVKGIRGD
jgi:lipopolysaccharide biosynthesis regulator YciM